ncbi:MAG TPA: hypothetical protein DCE71_03915 [Parachlamydiales bacterium]|nr:hypothetical protein [Parachlamydiales bacterium]
MATSLKGTSQGPSAFLPEPYFISEDSLSSKIASCIPVLGCFISYAEKENLNLKIKKLIPSGEREYSAGNVLRAIELMKVRKDYLVADLGRDLLSLVIIISGLALGVFSGFIPALFLGFFTLATIFSAMDVDKHQRLIHSLEHRLEGIGV